MIEINKITVECLKCKKCKHYYQKGNKDYCEIDISICCFEEVEEQ